MLDAFVVKRLGRPHENVVAAIFGIESEIVKHPFQFAGNMIDLFLRRSAVFFGRTLDVDAVLVRPGEKIYVESTLFLIAVYRVRDDCRVKMAKVRQAVGVIDRGCYVKGLHHQKHKV